MPAWREGRHSLRWSALRCGSGDGSLGAFRAARFRERRVVVAGAPFELVPAVVNSYGGWHPNCARWWRGAVRAAAEWAGPTASQSGMLWRAVGFLSVTPQRQNFQVLAGRAPGLEEQVQGCLGS